MSDEFPNAMATIRALTTSLSEEVKDFQTASERSRARNEFLVSRQAFKGHLPTRAPVTAGEGLDKPAATAKDTKMADDLTDLKLKLAAAETDKKFAEVLGEIRTISADLSGRMSGVERAAYGTKATVIITGIAIAALMVGILTYGQAWFGIGVSTRDIIRATVTETLQQHPKS